LLRIALTLAADVACAQHIQPTGPPAANVVRQPYEVRTFGVFRKLMLEADFSAQVSLADAMAKHPTTGVGALADARGEITIYDGRLIVSYGKAGKQADAKTESAALLVTGSARAWQSVTVERDVAPAEIESYLAAAARAHGVDPEKSFPYQARGVVAPYAMHVNAAPSGGPHGMGRPMAITVERQGDTIEGSVAGVYVSADLIGVATHGGERTHTHWVSPDGTATAHLERWGLRAGTVLLLPKP
jgi:alpha-acetolactate decarboxylase